MMKGTGTVIGPHGKIKMAYILKENATREQMELCGYKYEDVNERFYIEQYIKTTEKFEIFIPLEHCVYGYRFIQYTAYGSFPEDLNPEDIEDLVELGLVEEV
jgi:hypothetical protein